MLMICPFFFFFFFNDTATTEIYTLSLHDALPILASRSGHRPGSYARRAVRHRRECPLVGRGFRGHHLLRLLRALLRDRRDGAVPRLRARLRAGVRSL